MKKLKYMLFCCCVFALWIAPLFTYADGETSTTKCEWIQLNTNVPFVWNCIEIKEAGSKDGATTPVNAFPKLMGAMMNLMMTIILIMSLLLIVYAGVLMTMEWSVSKQGEGMSIIKKVAAGMALLWASWVILKIINPNFFT